MKIWDFIYIYICLDIGMLFLTQHIQDGHLYVSATSDSRHYTEAAFDCSGATCGWKVWELPAIKFLIVFNQNFKKSFIQVYIWLSLWMT